ncbi:MAG: sensor histidine kinase [Acidimicrobiia bacterium]
MRSDDDAGRPGPVVALKTEWKVLSGFGRAALIGVVVSMVITVVLGFVIPSFVKKNLIDSRIATFTGVATELSAQNLIPVSDQAQALTDLDRAVKLRLLGGDVVRVKLWTEEGTVVYSDAAELIGTTYAATPERIAAFGGEVAVGTPDTARPENLFERDTEALMEFYVPVRADGGETIAVFEVYERAAPLQATIAATRRAVWLSIGIALAVLGGFIIVLAAATARMITRRARIAEGLVVELSHAQEKERHRIVGALHDDIGQPLYRVLYGIQGCRSQMETDTPISRELERLEGLLQTVDGTLRTELRLLDHGSPENADLDTLLTELADSTAAETGLEVALDVEEHQALPVAHRAALFRAAREALTNARKHAKARATTIRVRDGNKRLLLDVEDDGVGVSYPPGLGLTTTRQRLEAIGGGLTVVNRDGPGTLLRAWVPLPQPTAKR